MSTNLQTRNFFRIALTAAAAVAAGSFSTKAPAQAKAAGALNSNGAPGNTLLADRQVAISDTIAGGTESVRFSGNATVTSQVIDDLLTKGPRVLLMFIDMAGVTGTGVTSGKTYTTTGQAIVQRPLKNFDPIEVSFAYSLPGDWPSARSALAVFSTTFNAPPSLTITAKLSA